MIFASLNPPGTALAQETITPGPADPAEIEAFFDGIILSSTDANHLAGTAVVIVKDGEILFSKGYGYADMDQKIQIELDCGHAPHNRDHLFPSGLIRAKG